MNHASLHVVTIRNFYVGIQDPAMRELFSGMLRARAAGYGPDYDRRLLPYDLTDFVAWHHLFCIRENDRLVPIGGFKALTLETADFYRLTLPILAIARSAQSARHVEPLEKLLDQHRRDRQALVYAGSWTIEKHHRGDPETSAHVRELMAALFYLDVKEARATSLLGMGAVRFKTDKFFETVGFERMCENGDPIPELGISHADNEPIVLMRLERFTDWAEACHEKHKLTLRARIVLGGPPAQDGGVVREAA